MFNKQHSSSGRLVDTYFMFARRFLLLLFLLVFFIRFFFLSFTSFSNGTFTESFYPHCVRVWLLNKSYVWWRGSVHLLLLLQHKQTVWNTIRNGVFILTTNNANFFCIPNMSDKFVLFIWRVSTKKGMYTGLIITNNKNSTSANDYARYFLPHNVYTMHTHRNWKRTFTGCNNLTGTRLRFYLTFYMYKIQHMT